MLLAWLSGTRQSTMSSLYSRLHFLFVLNITAFISNDKERWMRLNGHCEFSQFAKLIS